MLACLGGKPECDCNWPTYKGYFSLAILDNGRKATRSNQFHFLCRLNVQADDEEKAQLRVEIRELQAKLKEAHSRCESLEKLEKNSVPPAAAAPSSSSSSYQQQQHQPQPPSSPRVDVDTAIQEIEAIVPQYRAAIAALQGRNAILAKQLQKCTAENLHLSKEAARFKAAAERNSASFATSAAKMHSQEAAALKAVSTSRDTQNRLENEVLLWQRKFKDAAAEVADLKGVVKTGQEELVGQGKLLTMQSDTICRLEATVREQQEDIIAALDLVCNREVAHKCSPLESMLYSEEHHLGGMNQEIGGSPGVILGVGKSVQQHHGFVPIQEEDCSGKKRSFDDELDLLEEEVVAAMDFDDDDAHWTIPAATNAKEGQRGLDNDDKDAKNVDISAAAAAKKHISASPVNRKVSSSSPRKVQRSGAHMAELAADITALRNALKLVLC